MDFMSLPLEDPADVQMKDQQDYMSLPLEDEKEEATDYMSLPLEDPVEKAPGLTKEDMLRDPIRMGKVRQYMKERVGVKWSNSTDEELLDTFMSRMRFFGTNELRTLSEARWVQSASEEQKIAAGEAYTAFDEMAPFWDSGAGWEAVGDYAKAVLTSPSTWLGAGIGKIAGKAGATAGRAALLTAAKEAAKTGGREAAKKVLAAGVRQKAITSAVAGAVTDASVGVFQDLTYQDVMKDVGVQEEYNYISTALSGLGGLVGGAIALTPELKKGGANITKKALLQSQKARSVKSAANAAPRIKASVDKLTKQLNQLKSGGVDWQAAVAGGAKANPGIEDVTNNAAWFFDVNDPDSLVRIIIDAGAPLKLGAEDRFTPQMVDFVAGLPTKELDEINEILQPALGINLGQFIDRIAVGESRGGSMLQMAGKAKQYAKDFANISAATKAVDKNILAAREALLAAPEVPEKAHYVRYLQSLWRRMLVSHPATTAVNIQGWGQAHIARTMAELVHGGLLGTAGMIGKTVGAQWSSDALKKSRAIFQSQIFKAQNLLDPYSTRESFEALLKMAPKKVQDRATQEAFGGIGHATAPSMFGIPNPNLAVRTAEKVANTASKVSMMNIQDVFTKSFSGLAELDLQVRMAYGKGLSKLIRDNEHYKITDEMWDKTLRTLLQDTFSMDYTKTKNRFGLSGIADAVEKVSNAPGFGFLFPFGRFMNNNMAFMMQYSPIAFMDIVPRMIEVTKKGGIRSVIDDTDLGTEVGKAIVGSVALYTLIEHQATASEEGRQWFEAEDSTGTLTTEQNMAPVSGYRVSARILSHIKKGEAVPMELWPQLGDQLGPWQWSKELSGDTPISGIMAYLAREDNPDEMMKFQNHLYNIGEALGSQVLSGYTRPLDFPNKMVGTFTGLDAAIDRRQDNPGLDSVKGELLKYTDNIFELALGDNIGTTLRSASRPEGDIHSPNPLSDMVGRKELPPKNYTDKMLGTVDIPSYLFDQRTGIPEADRFINEHIAPLLNTRARRLMERKDWKEGSLAVKHGLVKSLLTNAREDVRAMLVEGSIGTREDRLENMRRIWLSTPTHIRDEVRKDLNISTPDRDLSEQELLMLRDLAGMLNKNFSNITQ